MSCTEVLKTRVTSDIKVRTKAIAESELLSEAAWLKQVVLREIRAAGHGHASPHQPCQLRSPRHQARPSQNAGIRGKPVYVRLNQEDRLLLDARAAARGMRPATYISVLTRSHLRTLSPLPKDELLALRRSIGELAAIGRNLNQIARVANEGGRLPASAREEFRAMLKVCEALRDSTKALIKANITSWSTGHAEANL
jgi:hypothetical protein